MRLNAITVNKNYNKGIYNQSNNSYKNYIEQSDKKTFVKKSKHTTNVGQRKQLYVS